MPFAGPSCSIGSYLLKSPISALERTISALERTISALERTISALERTISALERTIFIPQGSPWQSRRWQGSPGKAGESSKCCKCCECGKCWQWQAELGGGLQETDGLVFMRFRKQTARFRKQTARLCLVAGFFFSL